MEFGNRHSSSASALSYRHILLLVLRLFLSARVGAE